MWDALDGLAASPQCRPPLTSASDVFTGCLLLDAFDLGWWSATLKRIPHSRMSHVARRFAHLDALGLGRSEPSPVETLARSGGGRATDTVHVVPAPAVNADNQHVLRLLASGLRHLNGASDRLERLATGAELALRPSPNNPANPGALLLDAAPHGPVGSVPDYLLGVVHGYCVDHRVRVYAERINSADVPAHVRLLCRLEAMPQK